MKKILVFLMVFMAAVSVKSQKFTLGAHVGANMSTFTTDLSEITNEFKANPTFGIFARFGEKFYLQPELAYTIKGGELKDETDGTVEVTLKEVAVPVLLGWRIINLDLINLRIMAGPSAGFVVNKKTEAKNLVTNPIPEEDLKDIAWGLQMGAGVDVWRFTFDVRYELGLNDLYDPSSGAEDSEMKNNCYHFILGFKLIK